MYLDLNFLKKYLNFIVLLALVFYWYFAHFSFAFFKQGIPEL